MWYICCTHEVTIAAITLTIPEKYQDVQNSRKKWGRGPQDLYSIEGPIDNWCLLRDVASLSFGDMASDRLFIPQGMGTCPCAFEQH